MSFFGSRKVEGKDGKSMFWGRFNKAPCTAAISKRINTTVILLFTDAHETAQTSSDVVAPRVADVEGGINEIVLVHRSSKKRGRSLELITPSGHGHR